MNIEEALAWLRGERSSANWMQHGAPGSSVLVAQFDTAKTEQAYWIARAHHEGLVQYGIEEE